MVIAMLPPIRPTPMELDEIAGEFTPLGRVQGSGAARPGRPKKDQRQRNPTMSSILVHSSDPHIDDDGDSKNWHDPEPHSGSATLPGQEGDNGLKQSSDGEKIEGCTQNPFGLRALCFRRTFLDLVQAIEFRLELVVELDNTQRPRELREEETASEGMTDFELVVDALEA
jgi:hypothetical protein